PPHRCAAAGLQPDPRRAARKPAAARKASTTVKPTPGRLPGHRARSPRPIDCDTPHGRLIWGCPHRIGGEIVTGRRRRPATMSGTGPAEGEGVITNGAVAKAMIKRANLHDRQYGNPPQPYPLATRTAPGPLTL